MHKPEFDICEDSHRKTPFGKCILAIGKILKPELESWDIGLGCRCNAFDEMCIDYDHSCADLTSAITHYLHNYDMISLNPDGSINIKQSNWPQLARLVKKLPTLEHKPE